MKTEAKWIRPAGWRECREDAEETNIGGKRLEKHTRWDERGWERGRFLLDKKSSHSAVTWVAWSSPHARDKWTLWDGVRFLFFPRQRWILPNSGATLGAAAPLFERCVKTLEKVGGARTCQCRVGFLTWWDNETDARDTPTLVTSVGGGEFKERRRRRARNPPRR